MFYDSPNRKAFLTSNLIDVYQHMVAYYHLWLSILFLTISNNWPSTTNEAPLSTFSLNTNLLVNWSIHHSLLFASSFNWWNPYCYIIGLTNGRSWVNPLLSTINVHKKKKKQYQPWPPSSTILIHPPLLMATPYDPPLLGASPHGSHRHAVTGTFCRLTASTCAAASGPGPRSWGWDWWWWQQRVIVDG